MNSIFLKAFFFILLSTQGTFTQAATSASASASASVCRNYFYYSDILKDVTPEENSILTEAARIYIKLSHSPHSEVTDQKRTLNLQLQKFQLRIKINKTQMIWLFDSFIKAELSRSAEVIQTDMQQKAERDLLRKKQIASEKEKREQIEIFLNKILEKYNTQDINIAFVKSCYPNAENKMQTTTQEVFFLLRMRANVDFQDAEGMSAVMQASKHQQTDILQLLIQEKADLDLQNREGATALAIASEIASDVHVSLLLQAHATVDLPDRQKKTPLVKAIAAKSESTARLLLEAGAKADFVSAEGDSLLFMAVMVNHVGLIDLLVQYGAPIDYQNSIGTSALMRAGRFNRHRAAERLIQLGANVNLSKLGGESTLSMSLPDPSILKALIHAGAKINHQDKDGFTAAMQAATSESWAPSLQVLIENNADLSLRTYKENKTALDYARELDVSPAIELIEKHNQRKAIP